ncbi:MAG TPA: MFS transporter [Gammaproteobacteria bacterium]|jgi:UMF1 family MFS transporter
MPKLNRKLWGWALYYWANHSYQTAIITVFFPIFFKSYWFSGAPATVGSCATTSLSTYWLGVADSLANLVVVLTAPVLGAIADRGSKKKRFLISSAFLGSIMAIALYFVAKDDWQLAVAFYVMGSIGYYWGNIFADSMVVTVSDPGKLDMTSAKGYFAGYLGGGLFLVLGVVMSLKPELFGIADKATAVRLICVLTGIWWLVFSLPLLFWVPEPGEKKEPIGLGTAVRTGFGQLSETLRHIRLYRPVYLFLIAYWIYIDGVGTIIQMAVDYGKSIGFDTPTLISAVLMVQFIGVPAALVFGRIGERIGPRKGILIGLAVYVLVCIFGYFMQHALEFFVLAALVGLVQGGVQLLSRSYYARLVPATRAGEFFGFYNMLGDSAAVIGPFLMGFVSRATCNPRLSILSVILLFVLGAILLMRVPADRNVAHG